MVIAPTLRMYLTYVNKKRDREEGEAARVAAEAEADSPPNKRVLTAEDYDDITDLRTVGFRYRM
jgi:hypothetical protein